MCMALVVITTDMAIKKKIPRLFFLLVVACALTACATILDGENKKISIKTNSATSKIYLNGNYIKSNEATVHVRKRDRNVFYITQEGCPDYSYELQRKISNKSLITIWCWPCLAVDAASGALWDIPESLIDIKLCADKFGA